MKYQVVLLDPPWFYTVNPGQPGISTQTGSALHYDLMTDQEIYDLPLRGYLEDRAAVFLWATCPKLDVAMTALECWGLFFKGVAFVWVKTSQNGIPWKAKGVRPSVVKPLTELVLVASTKKQGRPLPLADESVVQTVFATPREHSRKPDEVITRIDQLYPNVRKLEMFGRGKPANEMWDIWGKEAEPR